MELMNNSVEEAWERNRQIKAWVRKRKAVFISAICVLVLVIITAILLYSNIHARKKAENEIAELMQTIESLKEEPIVVNPVAPEISLSTIYSEIKNIGELATVKYLFTDAARFTDSKQIGDWNIPFTEKSFTLKWDGAIKAGIDLEKVVIEVNEAKATINVSMPAAQILSYEIDSDSVQVLDEKDNIFNNITVEDKVKLDAATEKAMKDRAIENGLLEEAQENAKDIITRLLTANPAIGDEYTILFVITE